MLPQASSMVDSFLLMSQYYTLFLCKIPHCSCLCHVTHPVVKDAINRTLILVTTSDIFEICWRCFVLLQEKRWVNQRTALYPATTVDDNMHANESFCDHPSAYTENLETWAQQQSCSWVTGQQTKNAKWVSHADLLHSQYHNPAEQPQMQHSDLQGKGTEGGEGKAFWRGKNGYVQVTQDRYQVLSKRPLEANGKVE